MTGSQTAWDNAKAAIEKTYDGICTVYIQDDVTDPDTHITNKSELAVFEELPCRISFRNNDLIISKTSETASEKTQKVKLITYPDKAIPAGSKIMVTQYGVTRSYKSSGEPMVYYTHQEIVLELSDKWT